LGIATDLPKQSDNVSADLIDGVLTVRIIVGPPIAPEEPVEISLL
jgi:hypothetical protein